jgi:hypothetical protein
MRLHDSEVSKGEALKLPKPSNFLCIENIQIDAAIGEVSEILGCGLCVGRRHAGAKLGTRSQRSDKVDIDRPAC